MTPSLVPPAEHSGTRSSRKGPLHSLLRAPMSPKLGLSLDSTAQSPVVFSMMLVTSIDVLAREEPASKNRRKLFPIFNKNPGSNEALQRTLLHLDSSNKPQTPANASRTEATPLSDLLSWHPEDAWVFFKNWSSFKQLQLATS